MRIAAFIQGIAIAALFSLALWPITAAWSNGGYSADQSNPDYGTHDWIVDAALDIQTRDVGFLKNTYHTSLILGTEAPDNPEFIGDTVNHHVYFYESGGLQDDICADRASDMYETALAYLVDGDYESAAFDIGVMAHYVTDPGVFGHTMGAYTDWGAEIHHSDYEDEFESMINSLPSPEGLLLGNSDAYSATLALAETVTFGEGTIQSNSWMDSNYDWGDDIFFDSAMMSLAESVEAIAAVLNHMMIEAESLNPPPSAEAPQPPASLTASVAHSEVTLTWTPPPNDGGASITRYLIFRGTDLDDKSQIASVAGNVLSWTDDSVEKGGTYFYWVVAENSVGESDMVRVVSATVPDDLDILLLVIVISVVLLMCSLPIAVIWRRSHR